MDERYDKSMFIWKALPTKRVWLGAALVAASLLAGPLFPHHASAAIGYCRSDPAVRLSDGTVIHMSAVINDDSADVQSVEYTLHAPVGTSVEHVVYSGGSKVTETVHFVADETPNTFDTTTVVSTGLANVEVSAETQVAGLGAGDVSGVSGQDLTVHREG